MSVNNTNKTYKGYLLLELMGKTTLLRQLNFVLPSVFYCGAHNIDFSQPLSLGRAVHENERTSPTLFNNNI